MRDDKIDILKVNKGIPMNPRHIGVHLGNDQGCILRGCFRDIHTDPQAHIAMVIRRGGLDQGHINGDQFAMKQSGDL